MANWYKAIDGTRKLATAFTYYKQNKVESHRKYFSYTYIHNIRNWPLQHFSQDYGLASHTTHVVCVNFIQFNDDSKWQIFEKIFNAMFTYSWSFCQKSVEKKSPKKYFFIFRFDAWPGIWTRGLISQHTTQ